MKLQTIHNQIYEIRGSKVMLDFDLAELYGVEVKRLKESVRRNISRFPEDFMFELSKEEYHYIRTQFATIENHGRGKYSKYMPFAFTERGVAMLSAVLRSQKAIDVNISIMRAFVQLRQFALNYSELAEEMRRLESKMNKKFVDVYQALDYLIGEKQKQEDLTKRKRIGFKKN